MKTLQEAQAALEERKVAIMRGLYDRADAAGDVALVPIEDLRVVMRGLAVGFDVDLTELEAAAEGLVERGSMVEHVLQALGALPGEMWPTVIGGALSITLTDGYLLRAAQEASP